MTQHDWLTFPLSPLHFNEENITLAYLNQQLDSFKQYQFQQFKNKVAVEQLIHARSDYFDQLLERLWYYFFPQSSLNHHVALIAVGGYGRRELHPLSDIDLLILSEQHLTKQQEQRVSQFITLLWDLKLQIGHSVRTLALCLEKAKEDLTIMTNLIESHFITGGKALFEKMKRVVLSNNLWSNESFFHAKLAEQQQRHARYHSTRYKLEPDIKNSPGGLRDLHTLLWITLKYFRVTSIDEIPQTHHITHEEFLTLQSCLHFLWRLRFALHSVIHRYDNHLLFERQLSIARLLGYHGSGNAPVEQMMKDYYRVVHNVNELNQMLIQVFSESLFNQHNTITHFNHDYQLKNNSIDLLNPGLFIQQPEKIIELFYLLTKHEQISGIHSNTVRQLRYARRHFHSLLCYNRQARSFFLQIIRHPNGIKYGLLRMHQYGILAIYIPGWKQINGLMQFDLFHTYTVDEHTIRVLMNIANYTTPSAIDHFPLCQQIYPTLSRPETLIIAALFHDIGKGKNGDHSKHGAIAAEQFAHLHDLSEKESQRISWLIKNHLLMSLTAQNRDIQDLNVIRHFATQVRSQQRLKYLLCLTVADVCATNETLWNTWKQNLLHTLYIQTLAVLNLGEQPLPKQRTIVRQNKQAALQLLQKENLNLQTIEAIWKRCRIDYFIRQTPQQLAWQAKHLINHPQNLPLVLVNPVMLHGGTDIFIYAPDRPFLFAAVCRELELRNLNIHAAHIFTNRDNMAMDTFIVLEPNGQPISPLRYSSLITELKKIVCHFTYQPGKQQKMPIQLHHFSVPTQINFLSTQDESKTVVELIALDRPGLLACIGEVFAALNISLISAKVATIGKHIEDLFILTDENHIALSDEKCDQLKEDLINAIGLMEKI